MKKEAVLIVYNQHKSHAFELAGEISKYLLENEYRVKSIPAKKEIQRNPFEISELFLIITIGGDGTVLGVTRAFIGVPILTLNAGSVGFITETPMQQWQEGFEQFCCGEATISSRIMLDVSINRGSEKMFQSVGLNDVVISSQGISRLVDLFVQVDQHSLGRFRADGVIIATPTGSTAYSAAAGGPVLYPEMEAFVITPICPFSLSSRAVVVSSDKRITILVEPEQRTSLNLTVDGQVLFSLEPNDKIEIVQSSQPCRIVQCKEKNFFEVLREKLHWSGGPND